MEVEAHTHAIQWLASQLDEQITHVIILTDSMNLLQKVESGMGCPDWHTAMHSLWLQTFLWIYCPQHVGVSGNKQADRLTTYLLTPIAPGGAQAINDPSPSHTLLGCSGHSRPFWSLAVSALLQCIASNCCEAGLSFSSPVGSRSGLGV